MQTQKLATTIARLMCAPLSRRKENRPGRATRSGVRAPSGSRELINLSPGPAGYREEHIQAEVVAEKPDTAVAHQGVRPSRVIATQVLVVGEHRPRYTRRRINVLGVDRVHNVLGVG